jgi:hypothetical protein
MRTFALIAASGLALTACDPTTGRPTTETCAMAQLALVLAQTNDDIVDPAVIDRLRRNIAVLCTAETAERVEAEIETEVGEDVDLPAEVVAPE